MTEQVRRRMTELERQLETARASENKYARLKKDKEATRHKIEDTLKLVVNNAIVDALRSAWLDTPEEERAPWHEMPDLVAAAYREYVGKGAVAVIDEGTAADDFTPPRGD